jgi:ABC-type transport system substrate-binding protein
LNKSQYFYRTVIFSRQGDQVALADIENPELKKELEPWFAVVISLADGKHTLQELLDYLAASYHGAAPPDLEKTVDSVIERLGEGKLIQTSDKPVELPYYLDYPIEEMDVEKAKKLIAEDGYTQH